MKKSFLNIFLLIFIVILPFQSFGQVKKMKISDAVSEGILTEYDAVIARGYMMFDRDRFEREYPSLEAPEVIKCGTPIVADIRNNWEQLSAADKSFFQSFLFRPLLSDFLISSNGHFKIHYTVENFNDAAVPLKDDDQNGIPDYIDEVGIALERTWYIQIDSLGFPAPPDDFEVDGPEYDIYVTNISASRYYGVTVPESAVPSTPRNDYTSYIELDNDYSSSFFYTKGIDGMRVTAAHEFTHAIQYGIVDNVSSDRHFYEISAVWMEDVIYDEIDDYLQYVNNPNSGFIAAIRKPFNYTNGWHEYGAGIWGHYISKRFGPEVMLNAWLYMTTQTSVPALDLALSEVNSDFESALGEFYTWCYFTGGRADTVNYFDEANLYEMVVPDTVFYSNMESHSTQVLNNFLSAAYVVVESFNPAVYQLNGNSSSADAGLWVNHGVLIEGGATADMQKFLELDQTNFRLSLRSNKPTSTVLIVPVCTALGGNPDREDHLYAQTIFFELTGDKTEASDRLFTNIPNPFIIGEHNFTYIPFLILSDGEVKIRIVSSSGKVVKNYNLGYMTKGYYENRVQWDGRDNNGNLVPSGVYLSFMKSPGVEDKSKIAVIKR